MKSQPNCFEVVDVFVDKVYDVVTVLDDKFVFE